MEKIDLELQELNSEELINLNGGADTSFAYDAGYAVSWLLMTFCRPAQIALEAKHAIAVNM